MGKKTIFNSKEDSDKELIIKFKEQNIDITKTIANMLEEADLIATDKKPAASFEEIFGIDDWFFSVL